MNIAQTTYAALPGAFAPVAATESSEAAAAPAPEAPRDSFEFSRVLGAADALPGQQTDASTSGVCPSCGAVHGAASPEGTPKAAPTQADAVSIPDLHVLGAESSSKPSSPGAPEAPLRVNGVDVPDLHAVADDVRVGADAEAANEKSDAELPDEKAQGEKRDPVTGDVELNEKDQQKVEYLKRRDREVRTHEHAHVAAGGQHVRGGIQFEYETGPDGRRYAVGGEVSIDTSPVSGDPQATIQKAQTIRRAALAPAEPSGQDRRAASAASQMEMKARQELMEEKLEEMDSIGETGDVEDALGASKSSDVEAPEILDAGEGLAAGEVGKPAAPDSVDHSEGESKGGLPAIGEGAETHAPAIDSPVGSASGAPGLSVQPPASDEGSRFGAGLIEKDSNGLPENATPAAAPPVAKLDYGASVQQSHLVDMYG